MAPWRVALGIAIVGVLAVVTGVVLMSSFGDEPSVASTPIAAAPTTTASAPATVDPDPMPELHNTGEDFDRITRSLLEIRYWAYRHPGEIDLRIVYHPDCTCLETDLANLAELQSAGERFSKNLPQVLGVEVLAEDPNAVALRVEDRSDDKVLVDRNGAVIDRESGWDRRAFRLLLERVDGSWLIRDVAAMSAAPTERSGT